MQLNNGEPLQVPRGHIPRFEPNTRALKVNLSDIAKP